MGGDTFPSARMLRVPSSLALGPARDGARTLSAGSLFQRKEFPSRRAPRHRAQPGPRGGAAALRAAGAGPDCGSQQAARAGSGGRSDAIPGELVGLRRGFCAEGGRAAAPGGTGTMVSGGRRRAGRAGPGRAAPRRAAVRCGGAAGLRSTRAGGRDGEAWRPRPAFPRAVPGAGAAGRLRRFWSRGGATLRAVVRVCGYLIVIHLRPWVLCKC